MAWFRNIPTGREFSADGRWANAHRQNADNIEIDAPGAVVNQTAPVRDSDIAKVSKADLQSAARTAGVSDEGTKAELAERIRAAVGDYV